MNSLFVRKVTGWKITIFEILFFHSNRNSLGSSSGRIPMYSFSISVAGACSKEYTIDTSLNSGAVIGKGSPLKLCAVRKRFISASPLEFLARPIYRNWCPQRNSMPTMGLMSTALHPFMKSYIPVTVLISVRAMALTPQLTACPMSSSRGMVPYRKE
ncbi:hypothetical protein J2W95_002342 [Flavobacterium granuli]|uniref:Uncharacterized protein n=1 Tax=Flavobacterium granuli TaxID=280093 RepID=A0ABU1S3M5_9FLAO|nr:hypothetical protein [Flavobacterium granuli]